MSGRLASTCPALMKEGPSAVNVSLPLARAKCHGFTLSVFTQVASWHLFRLDVCSFPSAVSGNIPGTECLQKQGEASGHLCKPSLAC